jgi:hypothetical protein
VFLAQAQDGRFLIASAFVNTAFILLLLYSLSSSKGYKLDKSYVSSPPLTLPLVIISSSIKTLEVYYPLAIPIFCEPPISPLKPHHLHTQPQASRMSSNETLPKPLPIDYVIPTYGCKAGMRGMGGKVGWLNIQDARVLDFIQPAIFPETLEIWPPGSRSEIGWLHYKGEMTKGPTDEHPIEYDPPDWGKYYLPEYTMDLLAGKEMEFVRNVMRKFYTTL